MNPDGENLSGKRYVTVLVRLMVDQKGRLVQGEVVNIAGETQGRFKGWPSLIRVLQTAVAPPDDPGAPG